MALELLAGPFSLKDINGVAFNDATELGTIGARGYDDNVGLMANSATKSYTLSLDGVIVVLSDTDRVWYIVDLSGYPYIYPRKMEVADRLLYDKVYPYNKECGVRQNPAVFSGAINEASTIDVKLPDRYIGVSADKVYTKTHNLAGQTGFGTVEATLTKGPWAGAANLNTRAIVSLTQDKAIIAGVYPDGTIVYYDHINKAQVQKWDFIGPNKGAWYSERHGVWIRWGTDDQISIYAATALPHSLTNPAGAAPLKGKPQEYSVTLKGQHLELIEGELIDWSLGAGSPGFLNKTQSLTDASGVASVTYTAPVNTLGNVTLNATLRF